MKRRDFITVLGGSGGVAPRGKRAAARAAGQQRAPRKRARTVWVAAPGAAIIVLKIRSSDAFDHAAQVGLNKVR